MNTVEILSLSHKEWLHQNLVVREGFATTSALKVQYVESYDSHPSQPGSDHDLHNFNCFKVVVYM